MTSLLRKKHPTTRPSSRPTNSRLIKRRPLVAVCLVAMTSLAMAARVNGEPVKLEWGNERTPVKKTASAPSSSALRFVKPLTGSAKPADAVIHLAAYETDAPRLTNGRATEPETKSVVVNRDEPVADILRSAQLPAANTPPAANSNSKVEDGLRSPFSDTPEEPAPLKTPDNTYTAPANQNETKMPPPEANSLRTNQQPSATGTQPTDNQPATTPPATGGQFQPILPAGPTVDPNLAGPQVPEPPLAAIKAEGNKAQESCEKSLENLRAYTVDKVNLTISVKGTAGEDFPFECSIDDGTAHQDRCWGQTTYMWKASAMCHKPLYFEEEQLERYGHSFSPCFQPFVSGAHFFCTLPVLPYCMGVEPPCECIYALGHYRPGSCAPYMCNPIPLSPRGALFEAGAVTGAAAIFP